MCLTLRGSLMEQRIHESGLSGALRMPDGQGPYPTVLAVGGSDAKVAARDGRVAVVGASKGAELVLHCSDSRRIPRAFLVEGWPEVMQ